MTLGRCRTKGASGTFIDEQCGARASATERTAYSCSSRSLRRSGERGRERQVLVVVAGPPDRPGEHPRGDEPLVAAHEQLRGGAHETGRPRRPRCSRSAPRAGAAATAGRSARRRWRRGRGPGRPCRARPRRSGPPPPRRSARSRPGTPVRRQTRPPSAPRDRLRRQGLRPAAAAGPAETWVSQVRPSRRPTIVDGTMRWAGSAEVSEKGIEPKHTSPDPGRPTSSRTTACRVISRHQASASANLVRARTPEAKGRAPADEPLAAAHPRGELVLGPVGRKVGQQRRRGRQRDRADDNRRGGRRGPPRQGRAARTSRARIRPIGRGQCARSTEPVRRPCGRCARSTGGGWAHDPRPARQVARRRRRRCSTPLRTSTTSPTTSSPSGRTGCGARPSSRPLLPSAASGSSTSPPAPAPRASRGPTARSRSSPPTSASGCCGSAAPPPRHGRSPPPTRCGCPSPTPAFDVVTMSFGLRNVADTDAALREFLRVTRPGGRLVVCEFSQPVNKAFRTVYTNYIMRALPPIARRTSRNPDSYVYLAESIRAWPPQGELAHVDRAGRLDAGRLEEPHRRRRRPAPRPEALTRMMAPSATRAAGGTRRRGPAAAVSPHAWLRTALSDRRFAPE